MQQIKVINTTRSFNRKRVFIELLLYRKSPKKQPNNSNNENTTIFLDVTKKPYRIVTIPENTTASTGNNKDSVSFSSALYNKKGTIDPIARAIENKYNITSLRKEIKDFFIDIWEH